MPWNTEVCTLLASPTPFSKNSFHSGSVIVHNVESLACRNLSKLFSSYLTYATEVLIS